MNRRCAVDLDCLLNHVVSACYRKRGLIVLAFLCLGCLAGAVSAEPAGNPEPPQAAAQEQEVKPLTSQLQDNFQQAEDSVFVSPPRELIRPLIRANRALAENDIAQAVTLLGQVLTEKATEDYLVPVQGSEGLSISLRQRVQST